MKFDNLNINLLIIYLLLGIIIISVITLFITFYKNKNSNNELNNSFTIPTNLTLDNLKVKNIEIENKLTSPKIITKHIESIDKNDYREIDINDNIKVYNSSIYVPNIVSDGLTTHITGMIKNLKVYNGYISDFVNDNKITVEDFYNKANSEKEEYKKLHNL